MKKEKKPKPRWAEKQALLQKQQAKQQLGQPETQRSIALTLKLAQSKSLRLLRWLLGFLLVACISYFANWFDVAEGIARTEPEIRTLQPDATAPFAMPFTVKNPSSIFTIHAPEFFCDVLDFRDAVNNTYYGDNRFVTSEKKSHPQPIQPGGVVNYMCLKDPTFMGISGPAKVRLKLKYKTLWFNREYNSPIFIFDPRLRPPRWIEGEIR